MLLRIEGVDLPGRVADTNPSGPAYVNVHVGIQRRDEVISLVPADAESAVWEAEVAVKDGPDFGGPFIHGKRGARFVYLSWGSVGAGGAFHGFRRVKIHPADAGADLVTAAVAGGVLVARLRLTDAKGGPICATVRPPLVSWTVR
ncbi:DUF5990 family protein [Catenuloplanes sp. NPDC051500]|uniref:DUF5990 family protein n=1 Tax=Catenuloplanes sp. NPDC051500 TaxID=3363959 RepID=UPI003792D5C5